MLTVWQRALFAKEVYNDTDQHQNAKKMQKNMQEKTLYTPKDGWPSGHQGLITKKLFNANQL